MSSHLVDDRDVSSLGRLKLLPGLVEHSPGLPLELPHLSLPQGQLLLLLGEAGQLQLGRPLQSSQRGLLHPQRQRACSGSRRFEGGNPWLRRPGTDLRRCPRGRPELRSGQSGADQGANERQRVHREQWLGDI